MSNRMWMVRSASGGRLADECISKGVVAIGWGNIGDLSRFKDKKSIIHAMEQQWPDWKPGRVMSSASQLIRFRDERVNRRICSGVAVAFMKSNSNVIRWW